jgi:hypothetical protein
VFVHGVITFLELANDDPRLAVELILVHMVKSREFREYAFRRTSVENLSSFNSLIRPRSVAALKHCDHAEIPQALLIGLARLASERPAPQIKQSFRRDRPHFSILWFGSALNDTYIRAAIKTDDDRMSRVC